MINKGDALLPHEEYQDDKVLNSDIKIGLDNLLNYKNLKTYSTKILLLSIKRLIITVQ